MDKPTDDTDEAPALLWYWRHRALCVSGHDSLDDAVASAVGLSDHDEGAAVGVEVAGAEGIRWVNEDELDDLKYEYIRRLDAAQREREPRTYTVVYITPPEQLDSRDPVPVDVFSDRAEAEREVERLRHQFGPGRHVEIRSR